MGRTSKWTARLTEYELYKRWGKVIDSGSIIIDEKLIFDPVESGTKFTMTYGVKISGLLKMLSSRIDSSMREELKLDLINLRGILEARKEE